MAPTQSRVINTGSWKVGDGRAEIYETQRRRITPTAVCQLAESSPQRRLRRLVGGWSFGFSFSTRDSSRRLRISSSGTSTVIITILPSLSLKNSFAASSLSTTFNSSLTFRISPAVSTRGNAPRPRSRLYALHSVPCRAACRRLQSDPRRIPHLPRRTHTRLVCPPTPLGFS